jgi:HK97 gp10 family phage protein
MRDGIEFNIEGLDRLRAKFAGISEEMQGTGANAATRSAARLVARAAHAGALKLDDPKSAAEISMNIWKGKSSYPGVRKASKRYTKAGETKYRVGVLGGAGGTKKKNDPSFSALPGGDTRHWRFFEFGSENTEIQPFLRPALSKNTQEATNEFVKEFEAALDRAVRKRDKIVGARSRAQNLRRSFFGLD